MNQTPTRKILQEKPCKKKTLHEKQIKEESFFRQKKDLGGLAPFLLGIVWNLFLGGEKVFSGKTWFAGKVNSQSF